MHADGVSVAKTEGAGEPRRRLLACLLGVYWNEIEVTDVALMLASAAYAFVLFA